MDKGRHTAGPWRVIDMRHQQRGNLKIISEPSIGEARDIGYAYSRHPHADANARLIAAAPDLLAVLEKAVADAEKAANPSARFFLYDEARATIARATGFT